jgi:putative membrane protein
MWEGWGPWGWAGWVGMVLMMVLFWGGLIALTVWAVRSFARPTKEQGSRAPSSGAVDILEERFARGEIDREEFERRRGVLRDQERAG